MGDAEPSGQGRREVRPQLGDRAARRQVALPDGAAPEVRGAIFPRFGAGVILGGPCLFGLQRPGEVIFRHGLAG
jgi:hypothetical protein